MKEKVNDLRSAIAVLKKIPGQYVTCSREVDPFCEITGVYHALGARGTTTRPTKIGPMMMFENIKGFPGKKLCMGVLSSRERIAHVLGTRPELLGRFYLDAYENAIEPVEVLQEEAVCQEEVYLASDPDFDIAKIIPALFTNPDDAAAFITMGLLYAADPDDDSIHNATIHRVGIQGKDLLTIGFGGSRHIGVFKDKAFADGKPLQLSINIGLDPAIYLASCFEPPTTPLGYDELKIAGGMRGEPVRLARCRTVDALCIANAEYVIEGELVPDLMIPEDSTTHSGKALPEFHGYRGPARTSPGFRVTAVTCRHDPIMQACIGSSEEHVNMAGLPSEASILRFLDSAVPGFVLNAYSPPCGGGKLDMILQVKKRTIKDEGNQRYAGLCTFSVLPEVKNVVVVDEDVDIFDPYDVMWALTTRFRPDKDLITIPGVRGHQGDPTEKRYYDPGLPDDGIAHKAIYDATCPFENKTAMHRPGFPDIDPNDYIDR